MKNSSSVRRYAASALLAAGLASPACAAVCPKGIGGCTSPGRCFLFVDADANSLCDDTGPDRVAVIGFISLPHPPQEEPAGITMTGHYLTG